MGILIFFEAYVKITLSLMFSFNFIKFCAFLMLIIFSASGCRLWQTGGNSAPPVNSATNDELESKIPFAVREPENFQAEIVVTSNGAERRNFVARNGLRRRYDFNYQENNQLTVLQNGGNYFILPAKKIYAQETAAAIFDVPNDWQGFLNNEWLSQKTSAHFEKIETVDAVAKYRVEPEGATSSEIFIYVDENLGMPVKQEFYAVEGENKTLVYRFEIKNLKQQTDENLFAVPNDFKKVSSEEMKRSLAS